MKIAVIGAGNVGSALGRAWSKAGHHIAGALRQSRILEPFAMVWINQALMRGLGRNWAFGVIRPRG